MPKVERVAEGRVAGRFVGQQRSRELSMKRTHNAWHPRPIGWGKGRGEGWTFVLRLMVPQKSSLAAKRRKNRKKDESNQRSHLVLRALRALAVSPVRPFLPPKHEERKLPPPASAILTKMARRVRAPRLQDGYLSQPVGRVPSPGEMPQAQNETSPNSIRALRP